jgi:uncharacterized protein
MHSSCRYNNFVRIECDLSRIEANRAKHGIALAEAERFEWDSALISTDTRSEYGEDRHVAHGLIGDHIHCLLYTVRGDMLRVIRLGKANRREIKHYVQET